MENLNDNTIIRVLNHYAISVKNIESFPSFYKIETNKGVKLLRVWNDLETLEYAFNLRESIANTGFRKIDRFIRTKEGKGFIKDNDLGYSLVDWIDGRIPYTNNKDMANMGESLAKFHLAVSKVETDNKYENWSFHFQRGLEHFKVAEQQIKDKGNKSNLDNVILSDLPGHIESIKKSIQMAKKLEKNTSKYLQPILCHGNLKINSFKVDHYDQWWLIDLGIPVLDLPTYDIAKYFVNLYKDKEVSEEGLFTFIDSYKQFVSLKQEDKLWTLTYLKYPHEIWKFIYTYYVVKVPYETINLETKYNRIVEQQRKSEQIYKVLRKFFSV